METKQITMTRADLIRQRVRALGLRLQDLAQRAQLSRAVVSMTLNYSTYLDRLEAALDNLEEEHGESSEEH